MARGRLPTPGRSRARPEPVWEEIRRELRRKGVTLRLLWREYRHDYPDGYQYSRFCERYRRWEQHLDVVLRQPYRAGGKLFVDWAGLTLSIVEPQTGQLHDVYIFVAALGMSNMTYLEGALAQDLPSWIGGHVRAFEYFGGAAAITVPDNTKTAVLRACRYEPELNRTYAEMAAHYGTVILPPRPRKPRDRAKGEGAVQVVERVVLAPLRGRTFFSLAEVNHELAAGRERLTDLPFQKLPGSRRTVRDAGSARAPCVCGPRRVLCALARRVHVPPTCGDDPCECSGRCPALRRRGARGRREINHVVRPSPVVAGLLQRPISRPSAASCTTVSVMRVQYRRET